jgi:uncharacterized protein involved in oxidation of intracellular sulfur
VSERDYNALRLATALAENREHTVNIFLPGDGVLAGAAGQQPQDTAHNVEWMLRRVVASGAAVKACRTCMEARGMRPEALIEDAAQSTLAQLTEWTKQSDRVLVFLSGRGRPIDAEALRRRENRGKSGARRVRVALRDT